jgi:transposase
MPTIADDMEVRDVKFLPIVSAYAQKLGLMEQINQQIDSEMDVSAGDWVLLMVLDTLSGRSPLYRLEEFASSQDLELLLGTGYAPEDFNDDGAGRILDKIFEAGSMKLFTSVALRACEALHIKSPYLHFDTTSKSLMGDYEFEAEDAQPFKITYGYSKDKRPDLKQFVLSTLCLDRNIPILGSFEDGNASDKTLNNTLLNQLSRHLQAGRQNLEKSIYIADSALVTKENLAALKNMFFLTRLPATYDECSRAIEDAVKADKWQELGVMATTEATANREPAFYRAFESEVELYGQTYRAVVVHSSAHDKRRQNRLDRNLKASILEANKVGKVESKKVYACREDALRAAQRIEKLRWPFHRLEVAIIEEPKYGRGKPPKNGERKVTAMEYGLKLNVQEDQDAIAKEQLLSGCFVLISNVPVIDEMAHDARALLKAYKEQYGIEQNYGFLKDPLIVNSIFLKKPSRIEALGLILLLSLLIWRLMERSMRQYVDQTGKPLIGLDKKKTLRPTSYMITTKFSTVMVIKIACERKLVSKFSSIQQSYLDALNVSSAAFIRFDGGHYQDG